VIVTPEEKREDVLDIQLCHLHDLLHRVLDRVEDLEKRTTSLQEFRAALRCPACGSEMTREPIVAVKE